MRSKRSTRAFASRTVLYEERLRVGPAVPAYRAAASTVIAPAAADSFARRIWKRALDIALASIGLVLGAPLIAASAVVIMLVSPGAPFFAQRRIGLYGRPFRMFKLRTMRPNAESDFRPAEIKPRCDVRVFAFGAFLRRTSLDELPNLCNVLRGEMSIVGPRPMLADEIALCVSRHGRKVSEQRLAVRPGMTGLWQIAGRANLGFDERIALDLQYVRSWSPLGDMRIIAKTVPVVIFGVGAF